VILNAVTLSVLALLLGYFVSSSVKSGFESEIEDQLYKSALLAKSSISFHPARQNPIDLAQDIAKSLDVRVTIIAPDGRVLADSDVTPEAVPNMANHNDRPEVIQALETGRGTAIRSSATIGVPFIYVAITLEDGTVLRLAKPLAAVETLTQGLRRQLGLAISVGLLITLAFGYMVYAVVSRPLRRLAEASHELAEGNLSYELPLAGDRDLMVVSSSLNSMAKTLRRELEDLENDKRRTETIMASVSAGIVAFDREARVLFSNPFIKNLLDIHGEFTGRVPMELVRHPALETAVRDALKGEEVAPFDLTTSTGRALLAKAAPVRALSGQVDLVVVVFHDLTEIRRAEKMRKDFIANVSHEFKTPLTSIRGYAETLLTSAPSDPNLSREFLEVIERNAALLQALVDDLLILARLESEAPIERQPLNVRSLVEQQIQSRRHLLQEKDIRVELQCPPVEILADRSRLTRAISNLLDNAIHYNRTGGQIRISARDKNHGFALEISDTGVGIRQEDQGRIFERFYRVEKSRSRESGGTGLGLAIAKHAIESQGGAISVSSKLGSGSTFTIFLPHGH
jgi:two-component system, OmpR family, phosphate regulon sensor histidine kinase PhoR